MASSLNQSGIFYMQAVAGQTPLGEFPKEYRRRVFSGIDRRFTLLFAGLAVVICTGILILSYVQPPKLTEEQINRRIVRMQEKYLRMVEGKQVVKPVATEAPKAKTAARESAGTATEGAKEEAKVDRAKETFADKQKRREASVQQRRQQREAISKQVSSAGIFAAITAGAGRGGAGPGVGAGVSDLLGAADAVSSLDGISVSKGTFATRNVSAEELKARRATPAEQRADVGIQTQNVGKAAVTQIASAAAVNITSEPPEIKGDETQITTSKACITRVISRESTRIKRVYEDWLKRDPTLSGRMKIKFTILPSGGVSNVSVSQSTTNNASFDQNIVRYIQRWDFTSCTPASPLEIEVPFVFEGQA